MNEVKKFKILLKHYIEHSREHTSKYLEWAEKLEVENEEISQLLRRAAEKFIEGEKILEEIYNKLIKN
jgi:predicted transcriptional regulator